MLGSKIQLVAAIAEKQEAAVSQWQLQSVGLTAGDIRRWVVAGRIVRTESRTVFRMPGAERTWKQALWVAVLAGPEGTVVSHTAAASLWGRFRHRPSPT